MNTVVPEPIAVTLKIVEALDSLAVPYFIGDSVASTVHGTARTTLDADLIADLRDDHVDALVTALRDEFYVDADAVRGAVAGRSSFNAIHYATTFKVDVFVSRQRPFDDSRFRRRTLETVCLEPDGRAYVSTAEDTALAKLQWYRDGGEVSDQQWRDVLGVLRVQGEALDLDYLRRWADELGVADLLARALAEVA